MRCNIFIEDGFCPIKFPVPPWVVASNSRAGVYLQVGKPTPSCVPAGFVPLLSSHPPKCKKQTWAGGGSGENSVPWVGAWTFLLRVMFCCSWFGFFCLQPRSWLSGRANPGPSWRLLRLFAAPPFPNPMYVAQRVNLSFYYYYFWFNASGGHAVLQQNAGFSAQPVWALGQQGKSSYSQPTVTLTPASHRARASFVLLRGAYLAFRHGGWGPALPVRGLYMPWTARWQAGQLSAPCGGWETSRRGLLGLEMEIQWSRVSWVRLACHRGSLVAPNKCELLQESQSCNEG